MYSLNDELPIALCAHVFLFCFSELSFTSAFPLRNYLGIYFVKFKKGDFIRRVLPTWSRRLDTGFYIYNLNNRVKSYNFSTKLIRSFRQIKFFSYANRGYKICLSFISSRHKFWRPKDQPTLHWPPRSRFASAQSQSRHLHISGVFRESLSPWCLKHGGSWRECEQVFAFSH